MKCSYDRFYSPLGGTQRLSRDTSRRMMESRFQMAFVALGEAARKCKRRIRRLGTAIAALGVEDLDEGE